MRTAIVGLFNPHSSDPDDALRPGSSGSAGHRLWKMLNDVDPDASLSYRETFHRHNLARTTEELCDRRLLSLRAGTIRFMSKPGSTVVVLGDEVRRAFSVQLSQPLQKVFLHPQVIDGVTWRVIPHPSGRCLAYNDEATRLVVGKLLSDLSRATNHGRHTE